MSSETFLANTGAIVSVRGSVVDAHFEKNLPPINSLLHTGKEGKIVIEVRAQLDAQTVRGIALTPTQGLARGMAVSGHRRPIESSGGERRLSFACSTCLVTSLTGVKRSECPVASVHRKPPSLAERSTKSEIFETGIKAIDVLVPLELGVRRDFLEERA